MSSDMQNFWRKCSPCKKPIPLGAKYYVCSVSTCNGLRTGYVFCSMQCFESHLPGARHRDAAGVEKTAPMIPYVANAVQPNESGAKVSALPLSSEQAGGSENLSARARVFVTRSPAGTVQPSSANAAVGSNEILVIASRLKEYIQKRSDYSTSSGVMDVLSHHLRSLCDRAIDQARSEGRKTVMDRDFDFLKKS